MAKSKKNTTNKGIYQKIIEDPYNRVVERNLRRLTKDTDTKEIIENIKKYGLVYKNNIIFLNKIRRGTIGMPDFIKLMLATNNYNFNITVSGEELQKIKEFEEKKREI